jgi:diguanylate cyclase (GGDEF)-like protein
VLDIKKAGKPIEVLIIEDNPGDLLLTKRMLEKTGYTSFHVNFAHDLSTGIKSATDNKIDVILLDLNLPDSAGVETFLKLNHQVPEIPIVVLSGFEDEEESRKAIREGAQDYLIKGQTDGNLLVRSLRYAIERKLAEDMIKKLAYHDSLTGLPNRILFNDRYKMAMEGSKRYHKKTALIMLDLDYFKDINDKLGHEAGDELLKEVSGRLGNILRQIDTVCRMGGDEFTLLITELSSKVEAEEVVQRILEALRKPFILNGFTAKISASLGIAVYPDDGENLEILIKHADTAMYEVKKRGRNNYLYYRSDMNGEDLVQY